MFKQFIHQIPGADLYLVASLLIFLLFFVGVGVYLLFMDKRHIKQMSHLPLENQS